MRDSELKLKAFARSVLVSERVFILLIFPIFKVNCTHFQILLTKSKSDKKGEDFLFAKTANFAEYFFKVTK